MKQEIINKLRIAHAISDDLLRRTVQRFLEFGHAKGCLGVIVDAILELYLEVPE